MLLHVVDHPADVLKKSCMAQLVYLVMANRLYFKLLTDFPQVGIRRRDGRDARTRKTNLGSG